MKSKFPLLLAIGALGLAACAGGDVSSSVVDPGSSSTPDTSSTPEPGTSSDPGTSSTSSSSEEPSPWSADALALFDKILGGHEMPYHEGPDYTVSEMTDRYGDPFVAIEAASFDVSGLAALVATWTGEGDFVDNTSLYSGVAEGEYVLDAEYSDHCEIQADIAVVDAESYIISEGSGTLSIYLFPVVIASSEWPGEKLEAWIADTAYIGATVTVPEPTVKADAYAAYIYRDSYGDAYPWLDMFGTTNAQSYVNDLKNAGWTEVVVEGETDGGFYLVDASEVAAAWVTFDVLDEMISIQFLANFFMISWPAEDIDTLIGNIVLSTEHGTLPEPSFASEIPAYEISDYSSYGSGIVYMYGGDYSERYIAELVAAGFTLKAYISGSFYYEDPDGTFLVNVELGSYSGATELYIIPASENYILEWPTARVAEAVTHFGGASTVVVPAPTFEWDFGLIFDQTNDGGSFEVDIEVLDTDGVTLVDKSADYIKILTDAGWVYDETQDVYYDTTKAISVGVDFNSYYGVEIEINSYSVPYTAWPAEDLAALMTEYGHTGTIPALDGGDTYLIFNDGVEIVEVEAHGIDATELAAYEAALAAAGWVHVEVVDADADFYHHADSDISIELEYDDVDGVLRVIGEPIESWYIDATTVNSCIATLQNYDSGLTLPALPIGETTLGYAITYYVAFGYADLPIYFFDADVATNYMALLDADSTWTKVETPAEEGVDYSYSHAGNLETWFIDITVDTAADYCLIELYF